MPLILDLFYIQFLGNTFRFHTDFTPTNQGMESLSFYLSAKVLSAYSGCVAVNRRFFLFGIFGEEAPSAARRSFRLCSTKPAARWGQKDHLSTTECSGYSFSLKFPASPSTQISMIYKPVGIPVVVPLGCSCALCNLFPMLPRFSRNLRVGKCT